MAVQVIRLLGEGEPVSGEDLEALAAERGLSREAVEQVRRTSVHDHAGNLVGIAGLSLNPTPHRLVRNGRTLHTWCAWDGLFLAPILGGEARLESTSPADGAEVRVALTPRGVESVEPGGAVLSVVIPRLEDVPVTAGDVMAVFCHYVHFFTSPETAAEWVPGDQDATILSVEDGFRLAELVYGDLFPR